MKTNSMSDSKNSVVLRSPCPLTSLVAVKNFASDQDGHYDLDGVSYVAGEVIVATDKASSQDAEGEGFWTSDDEFLSEDERH